MSIDFARRRFLFGLAAVPLVAPAVKHFILPKWEPVAVGLDVGSGFDLSVGVVRHSDGSITFGYISEAQRRQWMEEVMRLGQENSFFFGKRD